MRNAISFVALVGLAACATPGVDYEARLPANNLAAAEYRDVEVGGFSGPAGGWYSDRFEGMLASALLDGRPWFRLVSGPPAEQALSGLYAGRISVDDVDEHSYEQTERKCVEWDGLFDCETRADVIELCVETRVDVSVYPELIDRATGEIIFGGRYSGSASDTECSDDHHHRSWGGRFSSAPRELIREALLDTLQPIRNDIAPRNARVRAPLVAEAIDPVARADPRFEQAVDAAKDGDALQACTLWGDLAGEFPNAPAVVHNRGACAEARGDYALAQKLYATAADLTVNYTQGDLEKSVREINGSLARISERRFGESWIDQADGYIPVPELDEDVTLDEAADAEVES